MLQGRPFAGGGSGGGGGGRRHHEVIGIYYELSDKQDVRERGCAKRGRFDSYLHLTLYMYTRSQVISTCM